VLTPVEVDQVVHRLSVEAGTDEAVITEAMVEQRIADVLKGPALPEDVARVSARPNHSRRVRTSSRESSSGCARVTRPACRRRTSSP
jgi:hypothetical protein